MRRWSACPTSIPARPVKLFAVKKNPELTAAELRAFLASRLTSYKVPKHIEFRDELPKTNVGKILRRALRDDANPPRTDQECP